MFQVLMCNAVYNNASLRSILYLTQLIMIYDCWPSISKNQIYHLFREFVVR